MYKREYPYEYSLVKMCLRKQNLEQEEMESVTADNVNHVKLPCYHYPFHIRNITCLPACKIYKQPYSKGTTDSHKPFALDSQYGIWIAVLSDLLNDPVIVLHQGTIAFYPF